MRFLLYILPIFFVFVSCENNEKKANLSMMNKSFKTYMQKNDYEKNFVTNLEVVHAISYEKIPEEERENAEEVYKAKIWMKGTTGLMYSAKIYNLNDTVTCFFNKDLTMLRHLNPNN